jgi:hypothetical protein
VRRTVSQQIAAILYCWFAKGRAHFVCGVISLVDGHETHFQRSDREHGTLGGDHDYPDRLPGRSQSGHRRDKRANDVASTALIEAIRRGAWSGAVSWIPSLDLRTIAALSNLAHLLDHALVEADFSTAARRTPLLG